MDVTEANDPYCLTDAEADRLLRGAGWRRVLIVGDSIAAGVGSADSPGYRRAAWYDRVGAALQRQHDGVVLSNIAKPDLRAAAILAEQVPLAADFGPDLVFVVAGGNDLFRRTFDPDALETELDAIVGSLTKDGALVVTVTLMDIVRAVPQLAGGPMDRLPVLNERLRAVSQRHGAPVLDAFHHPMCADRNVYSDDFKHPTMRGHAILAAEAIKVLGNHLGNSTTQ
jgi:lysophospholipase L1-like esterase